MWFNIFNPFAWFINQAIAWFSKGEQPKDLEKDNQIDEEDLPEDFDGVVDIDEEDVTE
jgi:hypothetical protein